MDSSSTVIGTLAVDGWAVIFGTARSGMDGLRPHPVLWIGPWTSSRSTYWMSMFGQCTNFTLFAVAL